MPRLHAPPDPPGSSVAGQLPWRRRRAEQHRGGAWKVAYADFVTALMALFIVLWMMNANEKVKQSVRGYFLDPRGYTRRPGAGLANSGEGLRLDHRGVRDVQDRIEQALRQMPDFEAIRNNVVVSVTGEGLRIDLLETEQGMFFVSGDPTPTSAGVRLLKTLAAQLSRMANSLVIEGHTDAQPFRKSTPTSGYGNWDLAADRANAARRLLHVYGVRSDQVVEMRGFADRRLLFPRNPNDPRNRRVSLVVKFSNPGG
jgi:chemotaxis protein MotB